MHRSPIKCTSGGRHHNLSALTAKELVHNGRVTLLKTLYICAAPVSAEAISCALISLYARVTFYSARSTNTFVFIRRANATDTKSLRARIYIRSLFIVCESAWQDAIDLCSALSLSHKREEGSIRDNKNKMLVDNLISVQCGFSCYIRLDVRTGTVPLCRIIVLCSTGDFCARSETQYQENA